MQKYRGVQGNNKRNFSQVEVCGQKRDKTGGFAAAMKVDAFTTIGQASERLLRRALVYRVVRRLHALGPRVTAEAIAALVVDSDAFSAHMDTLERHANVDAALLCDLGCEEIPEAPIHEVEAG
jgi:hypothetical protein